MANITISNLRPAGVDLFDGSESYLQDLSDMELVETNGGSVFFFITAGVVTGIYVVGTLLLGKL
jgi:hypothetical protein